MDINVLLPHLQVLTGNPETPEFKHSWSLVESFRQTQLPHFLSAMIQIYTNASVASVLRQLAIILCYQVFPKSTENFKENPFLSLNIPNEILSQLLTTASNCFSDESLNIRIGAANLFSRIACLDASTNDQLGITKMLITAFTNPPSALAFESICVVLIDLFTVSFIDDEELSVVLTALFGYLSSNQENVSNPMKKYCLKILSAIINNMGEVLTDNQNVNNLFTALFAMSTNPETKSEAFSCWCEFIINYYPMLDIVAQQLAQSSFVELAKDENDRETVINICVFWKSIAECELNKNEELHIIKQVVNVLLPLLFKISVKIPYDVCDNDEDYEPHIIAASAMQTVVDAAPIESMPILVKLVHEFALAQGPQNFPLREGALNCLNFIIQFCDCSPILIESLSLIFNGLNDSSPRVKQTAIYCIHAILNSILTNGDNCPFAALIPQIGQKIVHLSVYVMNLMASNVDVRVAATAASATADFIQFPGFPYFGKALTLLLETAIRPIVTDSLILALSAFSALREVVLKCPIQLLPPLLSAILQIVKQSIQANSDFWFISNLFFILRMIFMRLTGQINQETFQFSWTLFELAFNQYPSEVPSLLFPLAAFARASGQMFLPYLNPTAEFMLRGLETYDREDSIPSAAGGISLLSDIFDLSPFSLKFLESLTKAISNKDIPLQSKQYIAKAIGDLAIKTPQVFVQVAQNVMAPIVSICENVIQTVIALLPEDIFDDDFDMDDIICAFLSCLQKVMISLSQMNSPLALKAAESLDELLESVGGMKEHGDKLLQTSVQSMASLIQLFPNQMKENMKDEPGFIMILKEAQEAEIDLQVVQVIGQFLSS